MQLFHSTSLDPYWNLASEDYLLEHAATRGPTLYLWRSHDTVVIGKNQNPWRECDPAWMAANDILLARRISGGGAVYHDEGNLNYAFFCSRKAYRQDEVYGALIEGLRGIGIPAERMGKSSLSAEGRKFSGNAFCYRRDGVLHHGTLLVESQLERLERSLQPVLPGLDTRAIASEPMPVVNLGELNADWDIIGVSSAILAGFEATYGKVELEQLTDDFEPVTMNDLHAQFLSEAWRLDRTPRFEVELAQVFEWGEVRLNLAVEKGVIVDAGDNAELKGTPFRAAAIAAKLGGEDSAAVESWLRKQGL